MGTYFRNFFSGNYSILISRYRLAFSNKSFVKRFLVSIFYFIVSLFITYLAVKYANGYSDGRIVPDLLLDNIPRVDVTYIYFFGGASFYILCIMVFLYKPNTLPFVIKTSAMFFIIRAGFVVLTNLSAPAWSVYTYIDEDQYLEKALFTLTSGNDLFFSGHTGYPFLLALIFWQNLKLRYLFLACSIIGATIVIIGHLHYSIDVFSAFFITYGILIMAKNFFAKDYSYL